MLSLLSDPKIANVLSILTYIGSYILIYLTYRQARIAAQALREQVRPYIVPKIELRHGSILMLTIENIGNSIAENVHIEFDKKFYTFANKERDINNFPLFRNGISSMAPGEAYSYWLSQGFNLDKKDADGSDLTPRQFIITCRYSYKNKRFQEARSIELDSYFNSDAHQNLKHSAYDIAKSIEAISKNIERRK